MVDPAFKGVGKKAGVEIWRIEELKVVPWPKDRHGEFHTGDSYIVLHTKQMKSGGFEWDIHFWLGTETSQDEQGVAAYKTVELDDSLGGGPVQYREVQNHESPQFLNIFKKGVTYLEGGIKSGFKKVDRDAFGKRLLHIKGRRNIRVRQVAFEAKSLNKGDVFILDLGRKMWVWNGSEASRLEKLKGMEVAKRIRDEERHGQAHIHVTEEEDDNAEFFKDLGSKESVIAPASAAGDDKFYERKNVESIKLYRVSDASGKLEVTEVGGKPLKHAMLDTKDCFILDTGASGIYAWIGKGATTQEKKNAMKFATDFLTTKGYPNWTPVSRIVEGAETPMFKNSFSDWPERKQAGVYTRGKIAGSQKEAPKFDSKTMHMKAEVEKPRIPDDGSGKIEIWRIEDFEMAELDKGTYGQFFGGDSYVILYTYEVNGVEQFIIYFWQGLQSSQDERGASALHATNLDQKLGGRPVQVRVVQGKEPEHLLRMFKGRLVIHAGGRASGFKNRADVDSYDIDGTRLFHVKGTTEFNTRAVQVEEKASSLNSGDSFVLETPAATYIWCGKGCSGDERELAKHVAHAVTPGREHILLQEGKEPAEFWDALGGKTEYADQPRLQDEMQVSPPRLFQCSNASGSFRVEEIVDFTQEDLIEDDVMLLDTYDQVFVWVGKGANAVEKEHSLKTAVEYVKSDPSGRDLDSTQLLQVKQGFEPIMFTCHFHGWDPKKFETADSYEAMKASLASANAGITLVDEELEKYEKKYSYAELSSGSVPEGVNVTCKERYLSDDEFQKVFEMTLAAFESLPNWKRNDLKKKKKLF